MIELLGSDQFIMTVGWILFAITIIIVLFQIVFFNFEKIKKFDIKSVKKITLKDIVVFIFALGIPLAVIIFRDNLTLNLEEYAMDHPIIVFSGLIIAMSVVMIFVIKDKLKELKIYGEGKIDFKGLFKDKDFFWTCFGCIMGIGLSVMSIWESLNKT